MGQIQRPPSVVSFDEPLLHVTGNTFARSSTCGRAGTRGDVLNLTHRGVFNRHTAVFQRATSHTTHNKQDTHIRTHNTPRPHHIHRHTSTNTHSNTQQNNTPKRGERRGEERGGEGRGGGESVGDSNPSLPPADNVQRRGVRPLLARAVWSAQSAGDDRKLWRDNWGDCGGRRADVTVRPLFLLCSWLLSVLVHAWTERLFVVWLKSKSRHEKKLPSW